MNKENFPLQKETMIDLYNKYGIIKNSVFQEAGKLSLSEQLKNEGWNIGLSFRETDDHVKYVKEEIENKKNFYDFKIAFVDDSPFTHARCLLFREKK